MLYALFKNYGAFYVIKGMLHYELVKRRKKKILGIGYLKIQCYK